MRNFDKQYLKIAKLWAENSYARRNKVGAIIVKDNMIISDGEYIELKTKPEVLHAEANAITKLAKSTQSSDGATLYVTLSPCLDCAKLIIQSGIRKVVYGEIYRSDAGLKLLEKAGIEVIQININE